MKLFQIILLLALIAAIAMPLRAQDYDNEEAGEDGSEFGGADESENGFERPPEPQESFEPNFAASSQQAKIVKMLRKRR